MYALIHGNVHLIRPQHIVILNQGVGYLIITPNPYSYKLNEEVVIFTHHYVRQDINNLYGFDSEEKRDLFIRLIGVSGIGPKSALSILASGSIDDIIQAIEESNVKFMTKFPGIGPKSAQQIILDLKGKLVEMDQLIPTRESDAELALISLGYQKKDIKKALAKINMDQAIETIIKEALSVLLK